MTKLLITGAQVITMDETAGILPRADVLIENDSIVAIGPDIADGNAERIDAAGAIVMPGLVNAHQHTWQGSIRAIGADWQSGDYFRKVHMGLSPCYSPEDTYIGTLVGALAQIEGGTTTLFDWCHNNATPAHTDAAIDALAESGLRAVFGHGTVKPKPKPGEPHFSTIPHPRGEIERLRKGRLSSDDALVTLAACILGPDYSGIEVCRQDFRMARDFGLLSSAHIWGLPNRLVPDGYLAIAREGLLGPDHNIVHANYIGDEELKVILDSGASLTSTPGVELGSHPVEPLVGRILRMGGRPSIGPDTEVDCPGGMLEALRVSLLGARLWNTLEADKRLAETGGDTQEREVALPSSRVTGKPVASLDALRWATIDNARALRLDHRIGSLVPGKQADLIVIRRDSLAMMGTVDPVQAVVHFATAADVSDVIVAGRLLKHRGELPGIDRATLAAKQAASAERLFAAFPEALT
ncbi:amidohydrolase family protein [Rhizobiaceae bacterium BDR2-2]|uniref:Amidohydrolase family protein n=1 Tax=Ectorhizobium quercum TaxID=2965071 RepID=A0AAE3MYM1_9HYPH|nr:amidohydrolase family protein [Ectorhizobium quercum]MCX8997438.1 amidohydrolase family protein [Ectorhizobium quercum]